jgi:hypothetical protein
MVKVHRAIYLTVLTCILFLSGPAAAPAQNVGVPREPSTRESRVPQAPSATKRTLLIIAKAVIDALCAESGYCPSTSRQPSETTRSGSGEEERYLNRGFAGEGSSLRLTPEGRAFTFDTPPGWQTYEERSSVTVAQPSEYVNGDLTNGVILGLFDLNGASFERGTQAYVRGLLSNNKYLKRTEWAESNVVDNVPCITTRLEGRSHKTQYVENVIVYTCRRSTQQMFYVVTVNSGPNANRYEDQNRHITQTISFR